MRDPDCVFCSIISAKESAEVVARTATWIAFYPPEPATIGHTLVVPTNHVMDIWALSSLEAIELTQGVLKVAHSIRATLAPEGLNVIQSSGKAATQTVDHLHVHLVPRTTGDAMGVIWPAKSPGLPVEAKMRALGAMRTVIEAEGL